MRNWILILALLVFCCTKEPDIIQERKLFTLVLVKVADSFSPITISVKKYNTGEYAKPLYDRTYTFDTTGINYTYPIRTDIPYSNGMYVVNWIKNTLPEETWFWIHRGDSIQPAALPVVVIGISVKSY